VKIGNRYGPEGTVSEEQREDRELEHVEDIDEGQREYRE
jgi:hypothetical protein